MAEATNKPDLSLADLPRQTVGEVHVENPRITTRNVNVFYGDKCAIDDVTIDIAFQLPFQPLTFSLQV